jgi:hypothetical protein
MRYLLIISIFIIFYSCAEKENGNARKSSIPKEYLIPLLDSFNTRNLNMEPSLQYGISLDTINIPENKKHTGIRITYPRLSKKNHPEVYDQIARLIKNEKNDFYKLIAEEKVQYDSNFQVNEGYYMWIAPVSLYQTENLVSFSIESGHSFTGGTSYFEYHVINYDLVKKKPIILKDYFILNTAADTILFDGLISRALNRDFSIKRRTEFSGQINFSFDDLYIYFYLDRYDVLGFGISSIKKKYILEHINPEYR